MAQTNQIANKRLYILLGFLLFWFLVICGRLVWLQIINYGDYTQRAAKQQQRSIEVSPVRGNIYDRRGNELAMTVNVDSVFAVPSEVPDVQRPPAQVLARVLKGDASEIEGRMRASHAFAWIARKIDNTDQRSRPRAELERRLLSERIEALLSQGRTCRTGAGLCRIG